MTDKKTGIVKFTAKNYDEILEFCKRKHFDCPAHLARLAVGQYMDKINNRESKK